MKKDNNNWILLFVPSLQFIVGYFVWVISNYEITSQFYNSIYSQNNLMLLLIDFLEFSILMSFGIWIAGWIGARLQKLEINPLRNLIFTVIGCSIGGALQLTIFTSSNLFLPPFTGILGYWIPSNFYKSKTEK